ncbi:transducin beta-like protein 3 isoform X2 [Tubulanus polymorphus]|uniref:transducin beta-like protein 3 isoform X2 n=1 Tax=Tubulanus polymorphus TaxID=672921 RepID=UPI003DA2DBF3
MAAKLKSNFKVVNKYEAFYTGGQIQFTSDGQNFFSTCGNAVQVLNYNDGKVLHALAEEDDPEVTCFAVSPDDQYIVIASQHLVLRQWSWKTKTIERSWKAIHTAPVASMGFDCTSTLLATGGSDSTIKIWDIIQQYCTHNLKGHQGVVTLTKFHPDITRLQLFSAADDYTIRVWDLKMSSCISVLEGHYSNITDLAFTADGNTALSSGRDNVVLVWNTKDFKRKKTIPVYESIESVIILEEGKDFPQFGVKTEKTDVHFITAGAKGKLKVWNATSSRCVHEQSVEHSYVISHATRVSGLNAVVVTTVDHNILLYNDENFSLEKQFVGYNDDILDIKFFGAAEENVAIATNSKQIKVFNRETWDCQILDGHTDTVLCIDCNRVDDILVSSAKDNSVRVWKYESETRSFKCVAIGYGHTHAVNALAISRLSASFVVSGGEDLTLKLWSLSNIVDYVDGEQPVALNAQITERSHDKDINYIAVSPNDKLAVSASQDKTAKIWQLPELKLVGVLRGHKRGVWCTQFSPVDQAVVTSSADCTIKVWALSDFTCVKTFQGHESSVLKVSFVTRGMQLLSSGSDGLVKLWTIKSNECVKSFDEHDGKIWAMAVSEKENVVATGADDSNIILWKDVTAEELAVARKTQENLLLKEQELMNLLHEKKYLKAIGIAITLEQPFRVYTIVKEILSEPAGQTHLEQTFRKLRMDQIGAILRFAVKWNSNSKHCHEAQYILNLVLRNFTPEEIMELPDVKSSLEGLLPYTERHNLRIGRLQQQSTFIDYTWQCMKLDTIVSETDTKGIGDGGLTESVKFFMDTDKNSSGTRKSVSFNQSWVHAVGKMYGIYYS